VQEEVQLIGLSLLSGAHVGWSRQLLERLHEQGMEDIQVVGGVSPYPRALSAAEGAPCPGSSAATLLSCKRAKIRCVASERLSV